MARRPREAEEASVDLTPMLDVTFIMLIFFIVTASFVKEAGITVERPEALSATQQKGVAILVAINSNSEVWINRQKVDVLSVRATVEKLHAENPQGGVVIQADKGARNGVLMEVMDQVRFAGVPNIAISTEPE